MKWITLKKLLNSKVAKFTILIPLIGWVFVLNDYFYSTFVEVENLPPMGENIKISWKLYIFYLGLNIVAIASVIYNIFCPVIITKHYDDNEYVKENKSLLTVNRAEVLCTKLKTDVKFNSYSGADTATVNHTRQQWLLRNEAEVMDLLQLHYDTQNEQFKSARIAASISFILGIGLTVVPSLLTFGWVTGRVCQQLFG